MANEQRLIDANPIVKFIMDGLNNPDKLKALGHDAIEILAEIEFADTVDAVPVVHGRWENIRNFGSGECYGWCNQCKTPVKADNATGLVQNNRFCRWCGAKMDGDGNG